MEKNNDDFITKWKKEIKNDNIARSIVSTVFILPYIIIVVLLALFNPNPASRKNIWIVLSIVMLGSAVVSYCVITYYVYYLDKYGIAPSNKLIYKIIDKLDLFLNGPKENRKIILNKVVIIQLVIIVSIMLFFVFCHYLGIL